jgi:hypothetical protein
MKAAVLRKLILLGSFHYALREKEDQTARYLSALRNPTTQILGHPQGRIYNYRAGLNFSLAAAYLAEIRADRIINFTPNNQVKEWLSLSAEVTCIVPRRS